MPGVVTKDDAVLSTGMASGMLLAALCSTSRSAHTEKGLAAGAGAETGLAGGAALLGVSERASRDVPTSMGSCCAARSSCFACTRVIVVAALPLDRTIMSRVISIAIMLPETTYLSIRDGGAVLQPACMRLQQRAGHAQGRRQA